MLLEIRVRNFAVIDAVIVSFQSGLNVLTGETGAGKSMLLDAILLIRGARAQTDVIRTDTDTATVEAVFEVPPRAAAVLASVRARVPRRVGCSGVVLLAVSMPASAWICTAVTRRYVALV